MENRTKHYSLRLPVYCHFNIDTHTKITFRRCHSAVTARDIVAPCSGLGSIIALEVIDLIALRFCNYMLWSLFVLLLGYCCRCSSATELCKHWLKTSLVDRNERAMQLCGIKCKNKIIVAVRVVFFAFYLSISVYTSCNFVPFSCF